MAETEESRQMRAALGRDLCTRLEVERTIPKRFAELLRQLQQREASGAHVGR